MLEMLSGSHGGNLLEWVGSARSPYRQGIPRTQISEFGTATLKTLRTGTQLAATAAFLIGPQLLKP